jgi:hypothetical protein
MTSMIDRNYNLSEEEDFEINVKPLIRPGEMAEKLYSFDFTKLEDETVTLNNEPCSGWWIISDDFYERLKELEDDDEWVNAWQETEPLP